MKPTYYMWTATGMKDCGTIEGYGPTKFVRDWDFKLLETRYETALALLKTIELRVSESDGDDTREILRDLDEILNRAQRVLPLPEGGQ